MNTPTHGIATGVASTPNAIGWVTITIYALSAGQTQVQVAWPEGTQSGQANLQATRAQLKHLLHDEIDRSFDAWGTN